MNNVTPWLMSTDQARNLKPFWSRLVFSSSIVWLLVAVAQAIDLWVNGMPGSASQHFPADFNGSPAERFYYRGHSIEIYHAVLFTLIVGFIHIVCFSFVLSDVKRASEGRAPRFISNPRWRTGVQCFFFISFVTMMVAFVIFMRHAEANPHQWPQF